MIRFDVRQYVVEYYEIDYNQRNYDDFLEELQLRQPKLYEEIKNINFESAEKIIKGELPDIELKTGYIPTFRHLLCEDMRNRAYDVGYMDCEYEDYDCDYEVIPDLTKMN